MCFLISCTEKEYHFCDIPDQKPNHYKAFNKLKDILQSKWTMLFNSGKHMRKKKDGGTVSGYRQLEIKLKCDYFTVKGHQWATDKII